MTSPYIGTPPAPQTAVPELLRFSPYAIDGGHDAYGAMEEDAHGDYVNLSDYQTLAADNIRILAANAALAADNLRLTGLVEEALCLIEEIVSEYDGHTHGPELFVINLDARKFLKANPPATEAQK